MTTEDRNDILKFYIDAVYEHLKHSELRDLLPRNADDDRIAAEIAGEVFEFVAGKFDARVDEHLASIEREEQLEAVTR